MSPMAQQRFPHDYSKRAAMVRRIMRIIPESLIDTHHRWNTKLKFFRRVTEQIVRQSGKRWHILDVAILRVQVVPTYCLPALASAARNCVHEYENNITIFSTFKRVWSSGYDVSLTR